MSRITGSDAKEMMEAYQAVYAPQELTEEQVWEEVENWVNSLVEEGYDLSEYTWKEMYEAYSQLDEVAVPLIQAGLRAAPYILPAIGAATKLLQGRGQSKTQEPVDYGQSTYSSSSKDKPAPKPSWEKPSTSPSGSSTRLPSPAQPPAPKPPAKPPEPPAPKPPAKPPEPPAPEPPAPKPPKPEGPNATQRLLGSKARELRQSIGRGGKDPQGRGMTAAAGELIGSAVRTPIRQTLDVTRKVMTPLIAPAAGAYAAWKGATDLMNPETRAGRWIRGVRREDYEIIDIVKNYLIDNKYSNDEESALSIIENMSDEWIENILEAPELGSANAQGKIYTGPKYGYQSWQTASSKRLLPSEALGSEPPKKAASSTPAATPEPQRGSTNAQGKFYTGKQYGYQSWQTASAKRLLPSEVLGSEPPKARAATQPTASRQAIPATTAQPQRLPIQPAPAPAATTQRPTQTQRPPEPKVSPTTPAQTGDRTKDLTTWALSNKSMIDKVGTKAQREILTKAQAGETMSAPRPLKASYEYDAYDLVLEYLLSQGHTDTVEEAHYVMMEMDSETIGSICEAAADQSDKQIDKGVKTTYKAQNVLDNQHQGRSKGLNKLPRGEREEKAKRMGGRLKSRRDDLFGERNKREDSKREQLKKMLGL